MAGVSGAVADLDAAGAAFGPGQPTAVADALETSVALPSLVVPVDLGEVRVNVVTSAAGEVVAAAA